MARSETRKQRTRTALLDSARALFAERGFEATTIAAITDRAELGFGTFYLYFRDKEDILRAVVLEGLESLRAQLDALDHGPTSWSSSRSPGLRAVLEYAYQHRDLFRVLLNTAGVRSVLEAQAIFRDHVIERIASIIEPSEAELAARFVIGTVNQGIIWWFDHDEPGPEEMAERVERFILLGLLGDAAGRSAT